MKWRTVVFSLGAVALVCASVAFAEDRLVPGQYSTIQAAIEAAQPGDKVVVAPGVYTGAGNRDLDFGGKLITVQGSNPDDPNVVAATVIDCENSGRAFYFHSGETSAAAVTGLTITNGYADYGGAVYCDGGSPTISKCTFSGNAATLDGGAIQNDYCSPMVAGSPSPRTAPSGRAVGSATSLRRRR
jgi:predicted outer membrane repeat protein